MMNVLISRRVVVLALITLLAFGLRIYRLDAAGLSEDEAHKIEAVRAYERGIYTVNAEHPMLMKLAVWGSIGAATRWNSIASPQYQIPIEAAVRLPNAVLGGATVLVTYGVAHAYFGTHAEDLAALLLSLDLAPAHIVGSSYGAYTALALARDHPNLVRSLVLAEPPILHLLTISEAGDAERRAFSTNALDVARRSFARGDSVAGIRAYYDGLNGRGRFDALQPASRAELLAHSFEMRQEMLANREQYFPPISCGELGRVTTPVLIVRGERSPRVFQLISDELARCLRSDSAVVIPGAGHPPNAGNGAAFNQVVARFLASH